MFALGLVTELLEAEVAKLEAEDVIELMDNVADVAEISLLDKVFTGDRDKVEEDKDNVCGWDDDEDVSPLSLSPVSVTWKNRLLEAV